MTAVRQRKAQRAVHRSSGLVLVAYVYAPRAAQLHDTVRFIVLPLLVLTGIAMWQAPRIRQLRKTITRARAPRALDPPPTPSPAGSSRPSTRVRR